MSNGEKPPTDSSLRSLNDSSLTREGRSVLVEIERLIGTQFKVKLRDLADRGEVAIGDVDLPVRDIGRYQIVGEIATGGVGKVLRCRDLDLGRDIALKVIREDYHSDKVVVERFIEEAQVGGQLQHPGIVPVYELGLREDKTPYFTMKLVRGKTLSEALADRRDPADSLRKFLAVFEELCQAVAFAHSRGVVHRDIKPANILLGPYGEVLVVDWGFAKVLSRGGVDDERLAARRQMERIRTIRTEDAGSQSIAGSVLGTPAYMPPEQARGKVDEVDRRSDVFALGAILTEILTGAPAYVGKSTHDVLRMAAEARLEDAHRRLSECDADPKLVRIARGCLEAEQKNRPRSARVVANAIAAFQLSVEMRAQEAKVKAAKAKAAANQARVARRLVIGLAAAILLTVLGGVGTMVKLGHDEAAKRAAVASSVDEAMEEAASLARRGRSSGDVSSFVAAVEAARLAATLAEDEAATDELRERSAALLAETTAEAERRKRARDTASANRMLVSTLARIRNGVQDDLGYAAVDKAYRTAFRKCGIDVDGEPLEKCAERILETGMAEEIAPAIDSWVIARRQARPESSEGWNKLLALARKVDPDEWRNELREAWVADDGRKLKALAAKVSVEDVQPASLVLLGNALGQTGLAGIAIRKFRAAQLAHPDDFWINHYLAYWLLLAERWDETIRYSLVALALKPQSPVTWLNLGIARGGKGDGEGEIRAYRRALDIESEYARAWYNLAIALKESGERDEAVHCLKRAIRAQPGYALAHSALGAWSAESGKEQDAIASLKEAVDRGAGVDARLRLSRVLRKQDGDLLLAQVVMEGAIRQEPENADCHHELGIVLDRRGQPTKAILALKKACKLNPANGGASRDLVRVLHGTGYLAGEMETWKKSIDEDPKAWFPRYLLAVALVMQKDVDGAIANFEKLVELLPKEAWPLKELAFAEKDKDRKAAAETYRRALAIAPDDAIAWNDLGATLHRLGEIDEAVHAYRKAIELDPRDVTAHWNLSFVLGEQRRVEDAMASYENVLRLDPTHADAIYEYVRMCQQRKAEGDLERALAVARRGLEKMPESIRHHYFFGTAVGHLYGPERAYEVYRDVIETPEPKLEAAFLNNVSVALFYRGEKDDSLKVIRKAIELDPENATIIGNVVHFFVTVGDPDGAVAFARERLRLTPRLATVRRALATSLGWKGDPDLAVEAWQEAVRLLARAPDSGESGKGDPAGKTPSYYPRQAVGPPDVEDVGKDDARAWSGARSEAGTDWLEVVYDPPLRAHMVRIHEVCTAGGVVRVDAFGKDGETRVLWEGKDSLTKPGVLELNFEGTPFKVERVRIYVNTTLNVGWEEIDAVELVGPDGRSWAADAAASSVYGQNDIHAVRHELLTALYRRGTDADFEEMVSLSLEMVRALPGDPRSHLELGRAFGRRDAADGAEIVYKREFPKPADNLRASFALGMATGLADAKDYDQAVHYAVETIDLSPKSTTAGMLAGYCLGATRDFAAAERTWLQQVPRRVREVDSSFYAGVSSVMHQRGRPADAAAAIEKMIKGLPQPPTQSLVALAMAKAAMRDLTGATDILRKALARRPQDASLHRYLGDLLFMKGDLEEAIRTYRGGLALTRYHGWMNYHLGIALAESGKLEAGLDAIRRAPLTVRNEGLEEVKRWEHEVERLIQLRPRASGILSGSARPESGEEALDFARLCWCTGHSDVATRYFEKAFELGDWLAGDLRAGNRYAAARAAIRAEEYGRALEWLSDELEAWKKLSEEDPQAFAAMDRQPHFRFSHPRSWFLDSALAPVRDRLDGIAMSDEDRAAWKELWSETRKLLQR